MNRWLYRIDGIKSCWKRPRVLMNQRPEFGATVDVAFSCSYMGLKSGNILRGTFVFCDAMRCSAFKYRIVPYINFCLYSLLYDSRRFIA